MSRAMAVTPMRRSRGVTSRSIESWLSAPTSEAAWIAAPAAACLGLWLWLNHVRFGDVLESGFFGQSDNVVFRIEAYPSYTPTLGVVAASYQQASVSAQTYPFRVRGNQIQVVQGATTTGAGSSWTPPDPAARQR